MYLAIDKYVTTLILYIFSLHYLLNRSNSDIGIFGYIDVF